MEVFMKTVKLLVAGLVILAALSMGFISCGGDDGDDPIIFDGTWQNASGTETLTLSGGAFTFLSDGGLSYTGTFTYTEQQTNMGDITFDFTRFSDDGIEWKTRTQFIDAQAQRLAGTSWIGMNENGKQALREKVIAEVAPPNKETGSYTLNGNTLQLGPASIKDTYYRAGSEPNPPEADLNDPDNGILRVYNKTTSAGNYIKTIEVSKESTIVKTESYTGAGFSRNEYRDIELAPGDYGLKITRNTDTVWEKISPITITANATITIDFNILSDDWK
jgi:hypothetical protein